MTLSLMELDLTLSVPGSETLKNKSYICHRILTILYSVYIEHNKIISYLVLFELQFENRLILRIYIK